jgi:hypothetical protein
VPKLPPLCVSVVLLPLQIVVDEAVKLAGAVEVRLTVTGSVVAGPVPQRLVAVTLILPETALAA